MDLWEQIEKPSSPGTLIVRRADLNHPHNFFRGKNHRGYYLLQYRGKFNMDDSLSLPKLAGINITTEPVGEDNYQLTLLLNDGSQIDIFRALCANLMEATVDIPLNKDKLVVEVIIRRLERWQNLLKRSSEKLLNKSEQIGLFGEILLLRDRFLSNLNYAAAVASWCGCDNDEQDFLFSGWLIEVKSQMSSSDRKLNISSQDQLDTVSGSIIICHQTLSLSSEDDPNSYTLLGLIQQVEGMFLGTDLYAIDLFYAKLILAGYLEREEYDRDSLILNGRTYFEVRDGFPRIIASDLMDGIGDVHYTVSIDACSGFEISENEFDLLVFENNE